MGARGCYAGYRPRGERAPLGVLVGLTDLVSRAAIEKAITARAPKGTEEMNRKALQAGFAAAAQIKAAV